jgi:hypothetical protein
VFDHFGQQTPQISALYADAEHDLRPAIRSKQIDFCLPGPGNVHMRRLMIQSVYDKPEAVRAMDDYQMLI